MGNGGGKIVRNDIELGALGDEISAPGTQRKKRRYRPGTVALREIRHFQKTWNLVIPAAPFIRVVFALSVGVKPGSFGGISLELVYA
ncbi:histone H3-like centromeric protein htr12 [Quercus suber]|uniref:Histone H3-like centromeric protein htr12 n=1 Tax=Quercus suber TaxID=58331 RepID=A0AAW0M2A2_QUESU